MQVYLLRIHVSFLVFCFFRVHLFVRGIFVDKPFSRTISQNFKIQGFRVKVIRASRFNFSGLPGLGGFDIRADLIFLNVEEQKMESEKNDATKIPLNAMKRRFYLLFPEETSSVVLLEDLGITRGFASLCRPKSICPSLPFLKICNKGAWDCRGTSFCPPAHGPVNIQPLSKVGSGMESGI